MAASVKASYTEVYQGSDMMPYDADSDYQLVRTIGFDSDAANVENGTQDADISVDIALFETSYKTTELLLLDADNSGVEGVRYGDDEYDPDRLVATSSNDDILVSWAVDPDSGADTNCADTDLLPSISPRGVILGGSFAKEDTIYDASGLETDYADAVSRSYIDELGEATALSNDGTAGAETALAYTLCFIAVNDDTAATSTVTIKADGVTVATLTVTAVGPADSIALSLEGTRIAGDNGEVDDFVIVKVKDENGTVINGDYDSVSATAISDIAGFDDGVQDWEGNPENGLDDVVGLLQETDASVEDGDYDGDDLYEFDLSDLVCVSDEDAEMEGKSFTVRVENEDQDILSNAVTYTCSESGEDARVTKVTPEATTGGNPYVETGATDDGLIDLVATVVSANGQPLGAGSEVYCDDFDWTIDVGTYDIYEDSTGFDDEVVDGECTLGQILPGDANTDGDAEDASDDLGRFGLFSYTVTAGESDFANPGTDKDFALSYRATGTVDTVTIARVRNAAKTVATITFDGGEGAAFESVYFQVEKANGAVVEYRRRANGDGIARLVLSRRNTVLYVYAFSETSDESDTIKVRFR
jgi:hypothetical protein